MYENQEKIISALKKCSAKHWTFHKQDKNFGFIRILTVDTETEGISIRIRHEPND